MYSLHTPKGALPQSLFPMGNYVSCTLSSSLGKNTKSTKVILPSGEIRRFGELPVKTAELMLEAPNFFVVNSRSLRIGRRFAALNADEDLESAGVYAMFPMKRVNSVITAADLGVLFLAAKRIGKTRILPESVGAAQIAPAPVAPKLNLEEIEELSVPDFKHRLSMSKSKKPLLETIAEEPVC